MGQPLPIDDQQIDVLWGALHQSRVFDEVLGRAHTLALPGWYLASGCVGQTVWNVLSGRPPGAGVKDYDLPYFDATDLSWEVEDRAIRAAQECFAGVPCPVEVRNEARVHLRYEQRFGVPCPPYDSTEAAIATFPTTATSVGIRLDLAEFGQVFAPFGLADLLAMVVRANLALAPRPVYEAKVQRWQAEWPGLTVLPWPGTRVRGCQDYR
ncbi:MAG TPA: nucleotidyltransferase family protein [Candidatus Dormibacteraeota bacterium]|nr:nucleotidyltransferase family protein [Candidatus Dormibacteraeota bacterium]